MKMKFYSSFEKRMLYVYLKKMLGGSARSYTLQKKLKKKKKKKCASKCWFQWFFWELHWVIEGNNFLSRVECHAFVNRLINKYKKENKQDLDYYYYFE